MSITLLKFFQQLHDAYLFVNKNEGLIERTLNNKRVALLTFQKFQDAKELDVLPRDLTVQECREFIYYCQKEIVRHEAFI